MGFAVSEDYIADQNRQGLAALEEDYTGGALDPVATYQKKGEERPARGGSGSGIV